MQDRVTLTQGGLTGSAVALVATTLATGAAMHYLLAAPLPLVMLVTCLSPAAMVLLLYIGHLVRSRPQATHYLLALKLLGLASICMGLLLMLDFLVPLRTIRANVQSMIPGGQTCQVSFGRYERLVSAGVCENLVEGDAVTLTVTSLFHRVEEVRVGDAGWMLYARPLLNKVLMLAMALLLLYPMCMLRFRPKTSDKHHNLAAFGLLVAPSYLFSLVAMGLWTKFLLVHVLHAVDKM